MSEYLDGFTKEQKRAITAFKKAYKRLFNSGVHLHNCYGDLKAYQSGCVRDIDDRPQEDNEPTCTYFGVSIVKLPEQWTDDTHFLHLTEKGKKEIEPDDS